MDTTWRNITVKSRQMGRPGTLLLLCVALLPATMAVFGQSQGSTPSLSGSGGAASSSSSALNKAALGQGAGPVILPRDFAQLKIEAGDLLSVSVYDTPELTDAYRVDTQGNLRLPLCGNVKVGGLTAGEAAKLIEETLKEDKVLNQPQVNVDVQQYAGDYVAVLGEVISPGRVTVIAPTRLSDILAQVGGLTAIAGTRIKIRHGGANAGPEEDVPYSRSESNQQTGAVLIRPGDTVIIPRTGIVYVLGAVYHPGGYVMQEDGKLNVAQALALSGGTVLTAKTTGLRVIRRNPDGTVLDFSLSYDGIVKGSQTPLELQAQDIVYVPMSLIKSVFTDATSIISSATSAAIYTVR
jgi:polysaccharide biosynthesis/export protein